MRRLSTVIAFLLFCSATSGALACELDEVIAGQCPDTFDYLDDNLDGDRAALVRKHAWTTILRATPTGEVELRICAFVAPGPITLESTVRLTKIDYSDSLSKWETLMEKVEAQALEWNVPQPSALGPMRTSRLKFVFRHNSGKFRTCEDFPKSHVRIAFVKNANFSTNGTNAWKHRLNGAGEVQASMVLQPTAIESKQGTVQHEFGHALGFVHEMHHPRWIECSKEFNLSLYLKEHPKLYASAKTPEQMEEMARENLLGSEFGDRELASTYEFDTSSIMTYVIKSSYFKNKSCAFPKKIAKISTSDYSKYLDVYAIN